MSKRDEAKQLLDSNVGETDVFRSDDSPPNYKNKFERFTYTNHKVLLKNWEQGGNLTACNGFVTWYANNPGIQGISAWFQLENSLKAVHKEYAWVKPA